MIELLCFGPLELRADDGQPIGRVLVQPKRAALLAYLVLARPRGFHRRDQLVALFWPEHDEGHARRSLNQALSFLRRELGGDVVEVRGPDEVGAAARFIRCDVLAFEDALKKGDRRTALRLYRAELLPGLHVADAPDLADWLDRERERLRRQAAEAAVEEADVERRSDRLAGAIALARWALDVDPYDEAALRRLLGFLDQSGDRAGAVREYDSFRARLGFKLDIEPSPETQAMVHSIRTRATPST